MTWRYALEVNIILKAWDIVIIIIHIQLRILREFLIVVDIAMDHRGGEALQDKCQLKVTTH